MPGQRHIATIALAWVALSVGAGFQPTVPAEKLEKLKEKLAQQRDPADRAKTTVKIGEIMLEQAATAYKESRYPAGAATLEEYLNVIRHAYAGLEASGRNARKKPKGFKQLEIHLRRALIQMEDLARAIPYDERAPVEAARQEIEGIWQKLVRALFGLPPRAPEESEEKKP